MLDFLNHLGLEIIPFFIKALILFIGLMLLIATALKSQLQDDKLKVKSLNKKFNKLKLKLSQSVLDKKALKKLTKELSKADKKPEEKPITYVITFNGDIKASAVSSLREMISAILLIADKDKDEVLLKLESPGGLVHAYGLAASQLFRIKQAGLKLIISVDKVAASGGYMMSCLADEIISAPFAIVGSIGVLAQVPNFSKILKKNDVDYYQVTAGEFKRTLTLFGEVKDSHLTKFQEDLEITHDLFKNHIKSHRPQVDLDKVATGEHWYGQQCLELKLVDRIATSDEIILEKIADRKLVELTHQEPQSLKDKIFKGGAQLLEEVQQKSLIPSSLRKYFL